MVSIGVKNKIKYYYFIKINDEWKITVIPYRVFLSEPGKEINGLTLELSSDKAKYSISRKKDIVLKIKLRNKSKSPVKIIGDRWEAGENIFLKITKLPCCEEYSPMRHMGFIDYDGSASFYIIKPGRYVEKTLQEDEVQFMPNILGRLDAGYYLVYVVYTQYLGPNRDIEITKDEWKGRVTSNPILLEITK